METFPLGGLETAGLQRAKRFRVNGGLVLDARAGEFIPNGRNDRSSGARRACEDLLHCLVFLAGDNRSHRGATLLALLGAGAGGADAMMERDGHFRIRITTLHLAASMPSRILFVSVKIA